MSHGLRVKKAPDGVHVLLAPGEVAAHIGQELHPVGGALASHGVALHVVVEHFVGVELGAVAGKEEELYWLAVFGHPFTHLAAVMDVMVVNDEAR